MTSSPLFLDIETDGLDPTTIWMAVTRQDGQSQVHYSADTLSDALQGSFSVIGHNLIGFDLPVLKRLWGLSVASERIQDTLVLSRLANPAREGGHRLANWGEILGYPKGDHSDWSCYSKEMEEYCIRDVEVTEKAYNKLRIELLKFSKQSIELEHQVQCVIQQQIRNGWLLDTRHAMDLLATLKERQIALEDEVQQVFKPKWVDVKEVTPKTKKDGSLSKVGLTDDEYAKIQETGDRSPFMRKHLKPFNLGSRRQIGEYLQDFGWEPKVKTPTGQPVVDESILSTVKGIPQAQLIAEYLMVQKRVAQVDSWIEAANEDTGRVHGYVNSNGAVTGRMTHSKPNVAQVPASRAPYGEACRQCWTVPKNRVLVGFDASGLELRMLAHYMNDKEYTNEILHGDIHTANQKLAGLESRDQAKTFIYAFLYGAGDAKLGTIVGGNARTGSALRARFLDGLPTLKDLTERVQRDAEKGILEGLDGRLLHVRSAHAALNTLLQGAGAIVMKKALTILEEYARLWKLNYSFIGNIHDEVQSEVQPEQADKFGALAVSCLEAAGLAFDLNCPLTGEYSVGRNWSETH